MKKVSIWVQIISLLFADAAEFSALWRKVTVSRTKALAPRNELLQAVNVIDCRNKCFHSMWCFLACWDGSTGECTLSEAIFAGKYVEREPNGDLIHCFTKETGDIVMGKSITGTPNHRWYPQRVVENLVDGFYDQNIENCYISKENVAKKWLMVDMGRKYRIKEVLLYCQPNDLASKFCKNLKFKVGNSSDSTKLLNYGEFAGPGVSNQRVVLREGQHPVVGQFVYVESVDRMQICHLQVKGSLVGL